MDKEVSKDELIEQVLALKIFGAGDDLKNFNKTQLEEILVFNQKNEDDKALLAETNNEDLIDKMIKNKKIDEEVRSKLKQEVIAKRQAFQQIKKLKSELRLVFENVMNILK